MSKTIIKNGKTEKCPTCGATIIIHSDNEILLRNATLIHLIKNKCTKAKCRRCKEDIEFEYNIT